MLRTTISDIADEAGASAIAVSYYDYETATAWSTHGGRWFHAASTIKVAVLIGLFDAADKGRFELRDRLHVRNRFVSIADGSLYRISTSTDSNETVHHAIGKLMRLRDLAGHMIATSSNLATNLLLDLVGVDFVNEALATRGVRGIDLKRGVEDTPAFEAGLSNRTTSDGLVALFRVIEEAEGFSSESADEMLKILRSQEFRSGIPAGLPDAVRSDATIAHKTGDMSRVNHDAGLVYLPDRKPYAVAILTEWESDASGRRETVARLSRAVFEHLTAT